MGSFVGDLFTIFLTIAIEDFKVKFGRFFMSIGVISTFVKKVFRSGYPHHMELENCLDSLQILIA